MAVDDHAVPDGDAAPWGEALRAAQRGDETAFRLVYRAQQPALLRYLAVLVGEDAEDVASEAWLQIARDLGTFRGDWDGFRGWTATIARHRALDHLRRTRRRPVAAVPVESCTAELVAAQDTADQALELIGMDRALELIATLPRDQAEAVMLRAVVGLDAQAAGRILGKRAGAVRTAAYRGLRGLSRLLARDGSGPAVGGAAVSPAAGGAVSPAAGEGGGQPAGRRRVTSAGASTLKGLR